jgi:hypothetical protein
LFAFCFYEIDFTVTGTDAWTQMCASAGGFAMGCNPHVDYGWKPPTGNGFSREFFISLPSMFDNGGSSCSSNCRV